MMILLSAAQKDQKSPKTIQNIHPARLVSRCQVLLRSREDYQKTVFGVFSQLVFGVPVSGRPLKIGFRIFVHCIFMQTSTHPVSGRPLKIGSQIFSPAGLRCPGLPKNPKFQISNFRHSLDWSETKRAGCIQIRRCDCLGDGGCFAQPQKLICMEPVVFC